MKYEACRDVGNDAERVFSTVEGRTHGEEEEKEEEEEEEEERAAKDTLETGQRKNVLRKTVCKVTTSNKHLK